MISKRKMARWMLGLALAAGFVSVAPEIYCRQAAAAAAEPTAEQIVEKYIEVTGGRPAYEKLKSRVSTGKLAVPAQGLNATVTTYQKAPNLYYFRLDLGAFGVVERGFNGDIAWEKEPQTGTRIVSGEEKKQFVRDAAIQNELDWKSQFGKMENKGVEEVNGTKCYKVELTDKDGILQTRFYNVQTGLVDRLDTTMKSQMADLPVVSTMSDYRDAGGVKLPFKMTQVLTSNGTSIEMTTDKVESNVDIAADRFELPEDVKELAKKSPATQPSK